MKNLEESVVLICMLLATALGRTVRYKIITTEDGSRELVDAHNGTIRSPELDFLTQDLNISDTSPHATTMKDRMDELSLVESPSATEGTDDTLKLMNKWNSFTYNGWAKNRNIFVNSTKLQVYDDGSKNSREIKGAMNISGNDIEDVGLTNSIEDSGEFSDSKSEDQAPNDIVEKNPDPGLWHVFDRIYSCFQNPSRIGGTLQCLKTRLSSLILRFMDSSLGSSRKGYEEKTLTHGKKLLKGALLPLLVLLVIKYLVALPVIAVGLITIKTFWLSLMSAGVAAFGNPWKKGIIPKRYEVEHLWPQTEPAWSGMPQDGTRKNEYYM